MVTGVSKHFPLFLSTPFFISYALLHGSLSHYCHLSICVQVLAYAAKMHALVDESGKAKRSAGLTLFKADLAEAVARSMGAR